MSEDRSAPPADRLRLTEDDWCEILDSIDSSPRLNTAQYHTLWEKLQTAKGEALSLTAPAEPTKFFESRTHETEAIPRVV